MVGEQLAEYMLQHGNLPSKNNEGSGYVRQAVYKHSLYPLPPTEVLLRM